MDTTSKSLIVIKILGIIQLITGIIAAFYGPREIYVFYLFSEKGQFNYAGFAIGSFWFALLIANVFAYYLLALMLIPLGLGSIQLKRWALPLAQLYLWLWLAGGIFLMVNLLALLPVLGRYTSDPQVSYFRFSIMALLGSAILILLPFLLLRFYRSAKVKALFTTAGTRPSLLEKKPLPVLLLLSVMALTILAFHLAIFFQIIFPFFGKLLWGREVLNLVAGYIVLLTFLMLGVWLQKRTAWWGTFAVYSSLAISSLLTFSRVKAADILTLMDLPAYELAFLENFHLLQEVNLLTLIVLPLMAIVGFLFFSRHYFSI